MVWLKWLTCRGFRQIHLVIAIFLLSVLWFLTTFALPPPAIDPFYGVLKEISPDSNYAIATMLSGAREDYFIGTRLLTFQLLHANETRCKRRIPFLVLVTSTVSQEQRHRLTSDGAQVVSVPDFPLNWWIKTGVGRWKDVFTKLRLWEMVEYDRILFMDADTLLTGPVDDIFDEAIVKRPRVSHKLNPGIKKDEAQLPAQFVFAARSDNAKTGERDHPFPPLPSSVFSAGFWVMAPSTEMFRYLTSVMKHYHRFDPHEMEQSLLNYAFRRKGAMPWAELDYRWSATWPSEKDLYGGVASLHEKFWNTGPAELRGLWESWRGRMKEFYGKEL
jgi:alpha-N-acetylglucosamine transferase